MDRSKPLEAADLEAEMKSVRLRQCDLARLTGKGPAAVSRWCSGARPVPFYVGTILAQQRQIRVLTAQLVD